MPDNDNKAEIITAYKVGFVVCFRVLLGASMIALIPDSIFVKQLNMYKEIEPDHMLHDNRIVGIIEGQSATDLTQKRFIQLQI
jgi:uncharacterized membrane protein